MYVVHNAANLFTFVSAHKGKVQYRSDYADIYSTLDKALEMLEDVTQRDNESNWQVYKVKLEKANMEEHKKRRKNLSNIAKTLNEAERIFLMKELRGE